MLSYYSPDGLYTCLLAIDTVSKKRFLVGVTHSVTSRDIHGEVCS
jgi:hypothetical protein